jgi:hypothetical protein
MEFKIVEIKGQVLFKGNIIFKKYKNRVGSLKNLLKNQWARRAQNYVKAF